MGSEVLVLFQNFAAWSATRLREPGSYDIGIHLRLANDQMNQFRGCTAEQACSIQDQS